MPLDAGAIFESKFMYTANNQQCMNVLHWRLYANVVGDAVAITDALLGVLAGIGPTDIIPAILPLQGTNVSWNKVTGQVIWPLRYIVREQVVAAIGTGPAVCTAQNVQGSIQKQGHLGARNNVGGIRVGGLAQGTFTNGLLTADALATLRTIATRLEDQLTEVTFGSEWQPAILNKEKIPNTDPVKYRIKGSTVIFGNVAQTTLRTQRTRTVGKGI